MEKKDIFLKDEGDFITVGFQTEKAKKIIEKEKKNNDLLAHTLYGEDLPKMDIAVESQNIIIEWLISWGLSWEEC